MSQRDDYLWDGSGQVDPDVERLEELLRPLAHDGRPRTAVARAPRPARRLRALLPVAAAAVLAIAAGIAVWWSRPPTLPLIVEETQRRLHANDTFEATETERRLRLADIGRFTLEPGSKLQVQRVREDRTRFRLERGTLAAFVSVDAKPRFFEVETEAATCVDLGCEYTLEVDPESGDAFVAVELGRVAFQNGRREVFVPANAVCNANRATGAGTPYFPAHSAGIVRALLAFDRAAGQPAPTRRQQARELLTRADRIMHSLPVWHLLADEDPAIVRAAAERLREIVPSLGQLPTAGPVPDPAEREAWKQHLYRNYW